MTKISKNYCLNESNRSVNIKKKEQLQQKEKKKQQQQVNKKNSDNLFKKQEI